ncbi:MAG: SRPBCC family protein [Planctomycetes bacterium]|nr:SRPBCC family protein [Planctomycetota bacterium]
MNPGKLKVTTPSDREIVMTRELNAPRQLVWAAMTTPALIRRWLFTPPGWTMTECEEDLRVGGRFRWAWNGPDGKPAMAMHGVYREVVPGVRATRTETFDFGCESQAGEQLATIAYTEHAGRTTVTMTVVFPSKEARDGCLASGMEQGVSAGYDRMAELLASQLAVGPGRTATVR